MEKISTIGLDIAKNVFQVHAIDETGKIVVQRRLKRRQVLSFFEKYPPCLIGLEACATSHCWAREIEKLGHEVRLMPPRYVKPYVKRNKNDMADAEAICEAVTRPTMRFVAIKTAEQQSVLMLHKTRQLLIRQQTMLINAIRAHLAEFGIVAGVGRRGVEKLEAVIEAGEDDRVPSTALECLMVLRDQLAVVKRHILDVDRRIMNAHRSNELSRRLADIPGVGPLIATALATSVPLFVVHRSVRAPVWRLRASAQAVKQFFACWSDICFDPVSRTAITLKGVHHESSKGFYLDRTDDRCCDHRYSGCHRFAGISGLHGSLADVRGHDVGFWSAHCGHRVLH